MVSISLDELFDKNSLTATVLNSIPDFISIQNTNFKILFQNQTSKDYYGIRTDECCYKVYQPLEAVCDGCPVEMVFKDGKTHSTVKKGLTKKGIVYFEILASPLKDSSGKIIAAIEIARDITERQKAEKIMSFHSQILQNLSEGVYLINIGNQRIVYANPAFEKMFGYETGELIGQDVRIVNSAEGQDPSEIAKDIISALNTTGTWSGEVLNVKKDGTSFWCSANVSSFDHPEYGKVWVAVHKDITEQKQYEETLIAVGKELSEAQRIAHVGNWELDLQTGTGRWSDESYRIFGFEPGAFEPTFNKFMELVHTDDRNLIEAYYHDILSGRLSQAEFNVRIIRPSGEERVLHDKLEVITDKGGKAAKLIGINFDMTERKHMEETIKKSNEELELRVIERTNELKSAYENVRKLAAHLQTIQEEERKRIACDIHDELGQMLLGLNMDLKWLRDKYGDREPISDKADSMLHTLNATIQSVKRICTELRPSLLDDFGLVAAMEWQANEFKKRTGNKCTVIEDPLRIELDKDLSTVLYRIFQESLTNIMKHANATNVEVRLVKDDDQVILEIADNGKGITDAEMEKPQSFGLIGMRERVYPFGGEMKITGTVGGGTTIQIILPLPNKV